MSDETAVPQPQKPVPVACNTCRFWQLMENGQEGICRRFSPRPTVIATPEFGRAQLVWPTTKPSEWCGDWHPMQVRS